ncbi:Myohemerythrin [Lamellibrachia satsuma]|nr:Myohemerythrin [Lamellibrachia satsuma]
MSFEVPDPYVWDESFRVFYDNIDDEHKAIFEAIFACSKNPSSADLITKLYKVTEHHFVDEEGMMKKTKYSDLANHQKIHNDFLKRIKTLKAPLDGASVSWAKQWLVGHIKGIDFKYKGKL